MVSEDPVSETPFEECPRRGRIHALEATKSLLWALSVDRKERCRYRKSLPGNDVVEDRHEGIVSLRWVANGTAIWNPLIYSHSATSRTCMEL